MSRSILTWVTGWETEASDARRRGLLRRHPPREPVRAAAWVALSVILAACGSSGDSSGGRLSSRDGFCEAWAEAACSDEVISVCAAPNVEACVDSQQQACLELIPSGYSSRYARDCLTAVRQAYDDARLSLEELNTVLKLGEPCDRLVIGNGDEGDSCSSDADCDTTEDLECVVLTGETQGSCQTAEVVGPGLVCGQTNQTCTEGFYCNGSNCIARSTSVPCTGDDVCAAEFKCEMSDGAGGSAGAAGAGGSGGAPSGTSGSCVPRLDTGQACTSNSDCKTGVCQGVCVALVQLSPNEPLCARLR